MDADTQKIIIETLGLIALLTLIEIPVILYLMPNVNLAIITALISIPNSIVAGLIGFIAGKTMNEKQQEIITEYTQDMVDDTL